MKRTINGFRTVAALFVAVCAWCAVPADALASPLILYTADTATDAEGGTTLGAPADSNGGHLPAISAGVTLSGTGALRGDEFGPLNGNTYGPTGFNGNTAGSTDWVTSSFTFTQSGSARLFWEVANVIDFFNDSVLAIDNVRLTNSLGDTIFHFSFEDGIPAGFSTAGVVGTSEAVPGINGDPGLAPTEGSFFAFLDTWVPDIDGDGQPDPTAPRFDTVDGAHAAQLMSPFLLFTAGDTLTMDLAFITSDGGSEFHDYAVAAVVPEPGSLVLLVTGLLGLGHVRRSRRGCADNPPTPA